MLSDPLSILASCRRLRRMLDPLEGQVGFPFGSVVAVAIFDAMIV